MNRRVYITHLMSWKTVYYIHEFYFLKKAVFTGEVGQRLRYSKQNDYICGK